MCIFLYITRDKFQNFKINNIILESKSWVTNTLPCWAVTVSVTENSVSVHMTVRRYKSVNSLVSVNAAVVTARSSVKRQIPLFTKIPSCSRGEKVTALYGIAAMSERQTWLTDGQFLENRAHEIGFSFSLLFRKYARKDSSFLAFNGIHLGQYEIYHIINNKM